MNNKEVKIPEDAVKIIESVSLSYETPSVASHFMELGYSLAQPELQSLRQRIKELEDGLRTLRHGLFKDAGAVNEFIDILLNQK